MRLHGLILLCFMALLSACSEPATDTGSATTPVAAAAVAANTAPGEPVAVRLDNVFIDADPQLSGGGRILRGALKVGDRLQMLTGEGTRTGVHVDEIKDYATDQLVSSASAPAEVFVVFTADQTGMAGAETALVATDSFADIASMKAQFDAIAKASPPLPSDASAAARWGEVTLRLGDRALRMTDPLPMLRESLLSSRNLLDFVWQDNGSMRSPTRPPLPADAGREIAGIAATQPVMLSINAGLNDTDGEPVILDLLLPEATVGSLSEVPRDFVFEGTPSAFPSAGLTVYLRDGQSYFDASKASVTLTHFDARTGRFAGSFSATLLKRPEDIVQGRYDPASAIELSEGRFDIDLGKQ